ncbi:MAG: hypothetical protein HQL46_14955 [Gammaproteobacteria bacterium]|nr:hypothetical protein [Gammaproteobacteria bacterium]
MNIKLTLVVFLTALIFSPTVFAQQGGFMMQMQNVSLCMEALNKEGLMQKLEQQGTQFSDKIEALCQQGKKSQAQALAIEFSKKIQSSEALNRINKCLNQIPESMRAMMPSMIPEVIAKDLTQTNICEQH